jgi:hypothetical protein
VTEVWDIERFYKNRAKFARVMKETNMLVLYAQNSWMAMCETTSWVLSLGLKDDNTWSHLPRRANVPFTSDIVQVFDSRSAEPLRMRDFCHIIPTPHAISGQPEYKAHRLSRHMQLHNDELQNVDKSMWHNEHEQNALCNNLYAFRSHRDWGMLLLMVSYVTDTLFFEDATHEYTERYKCALAHIEMLCFNFELELNNEGFQNEDEHECVTDGIVGAYWKTENLGLLEDSEFYDVYRDWVDAVVADRLRALVAY